MNNIVLTGRLVKDPNCNDFSHENSSTNKTTKGIVCRLALAVDRKYGKGPVDYFNVSMFGALATTAINYLRKGSKVTVIGRLENNNYVNKDGKKIYSTTIIANDMEMLSDIFRKNDITNEQSIS